MWRTIGSAPRCGNGVEDGTNGRKPVLVTRYPFTGHHAPVAVARLTADGWISGKKGNPLWFVPTHWMTIPEVSHATVIS